MSAVLTEPELDALPPTQYLVLEVLAARYRTGEKSWPLPDSARPALAALEAKGLVGYKSDVMPRSQRAWLTPAGVASLLEPTYIPPADLARCKGCDHAKQHHVPPLAAVLDMTCKWRGCGCPWFIGDSVTDLAPPADDTRSTAQQRTVPTTPEQP